MLPVSMFMDLQKATDTAEWWRTYPTRLTASSSLRSTSPRTRNQPSSLFLGNRGAWALLSCFL
ncbi:hypothetical protein EYF80_018714 [Liparis tanakae]|uniref:Uncharacterized protein n=1 Tax=Liparis tanakae TaxID=230148 RepID=A0A4Z2I1F4_9TELE|nr:hypothetical protein EYF80_018714 [Liparis tanakae]